MNRGIWYAIGAYVAWGLLPVYWKWLQHVPALELITHRVLWSFVTLSIVLAFLRWRKAFRPVTLTPQIWRVYFLAALLIGINWLIYVWAVNAGFIIETSLGYFINPLFSVLMGVILFRERLRPWQWVPIGLAALGVVYLTLAYGALPWIALTLTFSFGSYGLVKKTAPLNSLSGLTLETGILFLPALGYLLFSEANGQAAFLHTGILADLLLVGAGLITSVPLLLFASATRRIPLSLVGILQYIAPTLQFLLGVFVYHEPFTLTQLGGYVIVWIALGLFAVEGFAAHRAQAAAPIAE